MAYIGASPPATALTSSDIADGIISEAKMANDAISLAELKAGTDGELITWDASANPAAVAAGTSGHFLKSQGAGSVPVFAAAASAPWVLIKNVTASNDSAVSFIHGTASVVVDSTYPTYAIIIRNLLCATDGQDLFMRYSQGGSIITTSKYSFHTDGGGSNLSAGNGDSNADNQDRFTINGQDMNPLSNVAGTSFDMTMFISNPSTTTRTNCFWHCAYNAQTSNVQGRNGCGAYVNDTTAVDGFSFYMQSGNITSGTFSLYGISN